MTGGTAGSGRVAAGPTVEELRRGVDRALERILDRETAGLEAGLEGGALAAVRHAVLGPGKRVRPVLLLGAHRAAGGAPSDDAAELACSVELVHAYSLAHDDLPCMDDDVLRRGEPTLHVRHGVPAATLAGAALMPLAAHVVWRSGAELGLPDADRRRMLAILARAAGGEGMVGGQLLDLRAEGRDVGREELEAIHRGKTAALMAAAVRMGAVAAGADRELEERLDGFGRTLGLAFQAVDDILDVTGDADQLGKTGGRDRALGKATYPSVLGLEEAERVSRRLARRALEKLEGLERTDVLADVVAYVVERRR